MCERHFNGGETYYWEKVSVGFSHSGIGPPFLQTPSISFLGFLVLHLRRKTPSAPTNNGIWWQKVFFSPTKPRNAIQQSFSFMVGRSPGDSSSSSSSVYVTVSKFRRKKERKKLYHYQKRLQFPKLEKHLRPITHLATFFYFHRFISSSPPPAQISSRPNHLHLHHIPRSYTQSIDSPFSLF